MAMEYMGLNLLIVMFLVVLTLLKPTFILLFLILQTYGTAIMQQTMQPKYVYHPDTMSIQISILTRDIKLATLLDIRI